VYLGVFSLAGTKLPTYVLPCYPALALLIGRLLDGWLHEPILDSKAARISPIMGGVVTLAVLGMVLLIAIPLAAPLIMPGDGFVGLVGIVPLAGALITWRLHRSHVRRRSLVAFAITAIATCTLMFGVAADRVDNHQSTVAIADEIRAASSGPVQVATLDAFMPSLVFYTQTIVTDCPTPQDAGQFLKESPQGKLVTRAEQWELLKAHLPPDVQILDRRRMFLRHHELLLIGRPADQAVHVAQKSLELSPR